ncbi:MAG: sugar phosphate isomerase/epimerase [Clostridia bacterium]|nr:sugar phosphate isomerase/epimerase [Clostridia bacterium]
MKLGIAKNLPHNSAEEWAQKHAALGLSAVVFPCSYKDPVVQIDAYVAACRAYHLQIAEVGAWKNLLAQNAQDRAENFTYCLRQLELADYVGASCAVNISGSTGAIWDGGYSENYSQKTYSDVVEIVRKLIDEARPQKTFYTLEPMPWMVPDSPECYLQMIGDIDRAAFAVHMDIINMISDPKKYFFNKDFTDHAFALLGKYIKSCHIKDNRLGSDLTMKLHEVPLGEGNFDIPNYIRNIDALDPDMPVIIEHLSDADDYFKAIDYLKRA